MLPYSFCLPSTYAPVGAINLISTLQNKKKKKQTKNCPPCVDSSLGTGHSVSRCVCVFAFLSVWILNMYEGN